jgi:hypothetical protein
MEDRSMTGTPLDLTPFGGLVKGIGWLYWITALGCAGLALWWFKRWWLKLGLAAVVLAAFIVPAARHVLQKQQTYDSAKVKLDAAQAHFDMRCKSAGEKITRTVENVEGVVWMKWRDKYNLDDDYDQFKLSDPYGRDCNAERCIEQLLRATRGSELDPENKQHARSGYRFVETVEPQSQELRRYKRQLYREKDRDPKYAAWAINSEIVFEQVAKRTARYGIAWDDISTREDRQHWIAGGAVKVIDLENNEVIAERVGYMMDLSQGSRAGFTVPWLMARRHACPVFPEGQFRYPTKDSTLFVLKVLKPMEEK